MVDLDSDPSKRYEELPIVNQSAYQSEGRLCLFSAKFSPDEKHILTGSNSNKVYIYDLLSNQVIYSKVGHEDDVNGVCWCGPDSVKFLSASDDKTAKLWDIRTKEGIVGVFIGHAVI